MYETERQAEIEEIERELQILRRRYANLDRAGKRMRIMTYLFALGFGGIVIASLLSIDLLGGGIVLIVILPIAFALWIFWRRLEPPQRWIDVACTAWGVGAWGEGPGRTEAMAIEDMVAERMERLARLRGNY
ncbi:hypothetical protein [Methyloligella solikamskensis]|uniref:Uncharacterized protein n=1 Tax=Methyloligella solikamskensis TaxID=1177756 RepID=A0ABW3J8E3_9HYPH